MSIPALQRKSSGTQRKIQVSIYWHRTLLQFYRIEFQSYFNAKLGRNKLAMGLVCSRQTRISRLLGESYNGISWLRMERAASLEKC